MGPMKRGIDQSLGMWLMVVQTAWFPSVPFVYFFPKGGILRGRVRAGWQPCLALSQAASGKNQLASSRTLIRSKTFVSCLYRALQQQDELSSPNFVVGSSMSC